MVCRILLYQVSQSTLNPPTKSIFIFCIIGTVFTPVDCIVCWKKKVIPRVGNFESLTKFVTYEAAKSLQDTAIRRSDNPQIPAQVSGVSLGNLVARIVWYHRAFFRNYNHKPTAPVATEKIEDEAYIKLAHEVVVQNGDVLCIDQTTMFYNQLLDPSEKERETSNRNIKAWLLTHFGDSIVIWAPPGCTSFVYIKALPTSVALARSLNALNDRREKSQEEKIKECARMIREQINAVEDLMDWPPSKSPVTTEKIIIPGLLEFLLRYIISNRGLHTQRVDRLVSSIAQDSIYNSKNGRSKTVKHVELALNNKRRSGNKAILHD